MKRLFLTLSILSLFLTPALLPGQTLLKADFNGDGAVNFDDFFMFAEGFGMRQGDAKFNAKFDLDGNGAVNFDDFFLFAADFGKTASPQKLFTATVRDLPADTASTGRYTYFSLRDSSIVAQEDSSTAKWDVAFRATSVIVNSGVRGPGKGGAMILTAVDFDTLSAAPDGEYRVEQAGQPAIPSAWYTYTGSAGTPPNTILMNPGVVLVIRASDGKYAKLKMVSYYRGGAAIPTATDKARFYTFTYTYQPDGSRRLKE